MSNEKQSRKSNEGRPRGAPESDVPVPGIDIDVITTNGNREFLEDTKEAGSAQSGGPDIEKAISRQPPDSTRPRAKSD